MPSPTYIPHSVRWWPTMSAREQGVRWVVESGDGGVCFTLQPPITAKWGLGFAPRQPVLICSHLSSLSVSAVLGEGGHQGLNPPCLSGMLKREIPGGKDLNGASQVTKLGADPQGKEWGEKREAIREEMVFKKLDNQHCATTQIGTNLIVQQMRNTKRPMRPHIRDSAGSFEVILKSICLSWRNVLLFCYVKWKIRSQTSMAPKGRCSEPAPPLAS